MIVWVTGSALPTGWQNQWSVQPLNFQVAYDSSATQDSYPWEFMLLSFSNECFILRWIFSQISKDTHILLSPLLLKEITRWFLLNSWRMLNRAFSFLFNSYLSPNANIEQYSLFEVPENYWNFKTFVQLFHNTPVLEKYDSLCSLKHCIKCFVLIWKSLNNDLRLLMLTTKRNKCWTTSEQLPGITLTVSLTWLIKKDWLVSDHRNFLF